MIYLCSMYLRGLMYVGATISTAIFMFTLTLCLYAWSDIKDARKNGGA
tara:strand:- start:718 stop:861 length:144 start_codon:yes stop_codon:yes gene_type:complete